VTAGAPGTAEWVDVSCDPHAYWRLLDRVWAECVDSGDSLMVVEHDVVCRPDVIEQFETCPEPWCVFGYTPICHERCREAWANMLGCTRFSAELIAACPNALSTIPPELRDWHNLCDHLAGDKVNGVPAASLRTHSLRAAGFSHHWHTPAVHHISWDRSERGTDG
jgi:hypothetical protein